MIHTTEDLDRLLVQRLRGIVLKGKTVDVIYGEPEEECKKRLLGQPQKGLNVPATISAISLINVYLYDEELNEDLGFQARKFYKPSGAVNSNQYNVYKHPLPLKYYYQVELYSIKQQDIVMLRKEVSKKLPMLNSSLIDLEGYEIHFQLDDFRNMTNLNDEERLFRYVLTYCFKAWYQEIDDPIEAGKLITKVNIGIYTVKQETPRMSEYDPVAKDIEDNITYVIEN